jgi:hypothetical protein
MRSVFALVLSLPLLLLPCAGCGGGRPDPRDRPDFVDDTDPDVTADMLDEPGGPGAPKKQPADGP